MPVNMCRVGGACWERGSRMVTASGSVWTVDVRVIGVSRKLGGGGGDEEVEGEGGENIEGEEP